MTSGVGEVTRLPAADGIARRDPNLNKQHRMFRYSGLMPTSAFCQTPSLAARRDWLPPTAYRVHGNATRYESGSIFAALAPRRA
jgi:hypothetical protein